MAKEMDIGIGGRSKLLSFLKPETWKSAASEALRIAGQSRSKTSTSRRYGFILGQDGQAFCYMKQSVMGRSRL